MTDLPHSDSEHPDRPLKQAIRRGLLCRCPACGEASVFSGYLKVVRQCTACGEELWHQRADDGPAYITMLIICHIAGFMIHGLFSYTDLTPGIVGLIVTMTVIPLSLLMLPATKGFMVAIQWSRRMHGFGESSAPQN